MEADEVRDALAGKPKPALPELADELEALLSEDWSASGDPERARVIAAIDRALADAVEGIRECLETQRKVADVRAMIHAARLAAAAGENASLASSSRQYLESLEREEDAALQSLIEERGKAADRLEYIKHLRRLKKFMET